VTAPTTIAAELYADSRCWLGEGPLWDDRFRCLLWIDVEVGWILRLEMGSTMPEISEVGSPIGALALREDGYVAAVQSGFLQLGADLRPTGAVLPVRHRRLTMRMNDGNVDPCGGFWAGSMAWDGASGQGSLYRLDPDRTVRRVLGGLTISNGLDWNTAGTRMYFVDSAESRISVFDVDHACRSIRNRRTFVEIDPGLGAPDGLTVDAEDGVWVALWGAGRVHGYAADGRLRTVVSVPTPFVSSCAFGGIDLDTLFITTARRDKRQADGHAGGVFAVQLSVRGRPANRCSMGQD
jgi:sugar lactone lactonase YvrE